MKSTRIPNPVKASVFASVIAAVCAFSATAYAQPSFVGHFTLPYEVQWGATVLPAGDYTIVIDSTGAPALVRSAKGESKMFTPAPIRADSQTGGCGLFLTTLQGERRVRSLNLSYLGMSLVYAPLSKIEQQMAARTAATEVLPVAMTRK